MQLPEEDEKLTGPQAHYYLTRTIEISRRYFSESFNRTVPLKVLPLQIKINKKVVILHPWPILGLF